MSKRKHISSCPRKARGKTRNLVVYQLSSKFLLKLIWMNWEFDTTCTALVYSIPNFGGECKNTLFNIAFCTWLPPTRTVVRFLLHEKCVGNLMFQVYIGQEKTSRKFHTMTIIERGLVFILFSARRFECKLHNCSYFWKTIWFWKSQNFWH